MNKKKMADSKRLTKYLILALCITLLAVIIKLQLPTTSSVEADGNTIETPPTERADLNSKDVDALIPGNWHVLDHPNAQAEGDLNGDGLLDVALVIEKNIEADTIAPRSLLIAFGNNDQTYTLSIIAENVILDVQSGGVWGDPFESLSIEDGVLVVGDYGGSNWRWYNRYQFKLVDAEWSLIGATFGSYFTGDTLQEDADEESYDFLTGDYIIKKKDEKGNPVVTEGNRGIKPLIKLNAFDLNNM